jgi:DNA primase
MDLLTQVQADTGAPFRRAASTNGGEFKGPCPWCGGEDRFCVWPEHPNGRAEYWCRQCGASGDLIQYLRDVHGMPFGEAKEAAGLDVGHVATVRPRPAPKPRTPAQPPPAQWQERAGAFVAYAQGQLWSEAGEAAREYLRCERGLREATIREWGLGYNPRAIRIRGRELERWGPETVEKVKKARRSSMTIAPGIVLPCQIDGHLWRVKIRVPNLQGDTWSTLALYLDFVYGWKDRQGKTVHYKAKYSSVKGGQDRALFGADALRGDRPLLLCEGEFDALLAWQELRDVVDVATLGGASKGGNLPGRWRLRLLPYETILVAYDADRAGERGAAGWLARSRRARRVRVSQGDDLTAFWKGGGDLEAWLASELARLAAE